jgi:hypothetical protein
MQRKSFSAVLMLLVAVAMSGGLLLSTPTQAQSPQDRAWTTAGSTGTMDETSSSIAQLKNFTVTLLPGVTGTAQVRFNITPTNGVTSFCPATQSTVKLRFRNSDNTGSTAKVSFDIHQSNITTGGNTIVYSFDSNGKGAGGSFTSFTDTPALDFDFLNNVYWVEATIFRSDATQFADLGSIIIWESAGTACP